MFLAARCPVCGHPVSDACAECWSAALPAPADSAVPAAVAFVGAGRRLVLGLKYANGRTLARPLAARMAPLVAERSADIVTWAPTSSRRIRRRGYDQAELIARALARELGLPCRPMLRRLAGSAAQTGRSRAERSAGAPRFVARRSWGPLRALLVDDVVTTGATLRAAERALRRGGCAEVIPIAGAATPGSGGRQATDTGRRRARPGERMVRR
jgi:predicted amidophosphoribosyltransferase